MALSFTRGEITFHIHSTTAVVLLPDAVQQQFCLMSRIEKQLAHSHTEAVTCMLSL